MRECFRIDSGAKRGSIMFFVSFQCINVYIEVVMKEVKRGESGDCLASCMQMT